MVRHFRLYLTAVLILFTLIFSVAIGLYDYFKGQQQILSNHEKEVEMIEESVVQSLYVIDQMYNITDETLGNKMKENIDILMEKYEENPYFRTWDFERLKKQFDMDVYIINQENVVIYSSFEQDVGLSFEECCGSFAKVIEKRRLGGKFVHDGMDLHQSTRKITKFAYMPTPDQKYLIELGMSLEEGEIYESFNILQKMAELEEAYKPINSIRMYNPNGLTFGNHEDRQEVADDMRPVFEEAKKSNEKKEYTKKINGIDVTYRYIPYTAYYEKDYPMKRVIEIVYNEVELEGLLKFYREGFIYQQLIILLAVILLAILIGKIISKPIYLAFHDSLTNLKNRASFEIEGEKRLNQGDKELSLMMIDIDNFKEVNDRLGHVKGDQLLINIAKLLEQNICIQGTIARIGGDEFVVICSNIGEVEIAEQAEGLLEKLNSVYQDLNKEYDLNVSISIGIAYAKRNEGLKSLYDRADQALYSAKRSGKNQYAFYKDIFEE